LDSASTVIDSTEASVSFPSASSLFMAAASWIIERSCRRRIKLVREIIFFLRAFFPEIAEGGEEFF